MIEENSASKEDEYLSLSIELLELKILLCSSMVDVRQSGHLS